ncbi:protein kinase family protein [Streptomyces sp. CBMA29]|uniref:protein kinase family protein n=1 Tax=Streptomyces sp. CBMA29 TaxID=1896314 RepID=UPI00397F71C6
MTSATTSGASSATAAAETAAKPATKSAAKAPAKRAAKQTVKDGRSPKASASTNGAKAASATAPVATGTPAKGTSAKGTPAKGTPVASAKAPSAPAPAPSSSGSGGTATLAPGEKTGDGDRPAAEDAPGSPTAASTATADGRRPAGTAKGGGSATTAPRPVRSAQPELHSGHKLARRYQLAECVTRIDGFSSWRAVDEKLRRAVGIHILPADHRRARQVLAAARSAALLGDPRFVQVLDAVEENDLVYVIHEWLPDASSLADLLAAGAMEPHEAYQMVSQVSQGMAAAHREGLAHLRLDPGAVLRTVSGQYRIRGLAVAAALRGLNSERPQRQDTEAIGALLYASLTQRWPYEEDAHGLAGLPKGVGLVAPDQVRAGVHRRLSELAMRALVNDGATASRQDPPCTTPEELAKAVAGIPRIRPPEQAPPVYPVAAFRQPPAPPGTPQPPAVAAPTPPPTLPGRTGRALKWAVSALVIVAIGLGSWQLADTLKSREDQPTSHPTTGQKASQDPTRKAPVPIKIAGLKDFDPLGDGSENPKDLPKAFDGDPSTYWETNYYLGADLGNLKAGVGVIVDLGSAKHVSTVKVDFVGDVTAQLLAAPKGASAMPTTFDAFTKVAEGSGSSVTFKPSADLTSRYVLVWLTRLAPAETSHFRGRISEISVTG